MRQQNQIFLEFGYIPGLEYHMRLKIAKLTPSAHIYGMNRIMNCISPLLITEKSSICKKVGKFI